MDNLYLEVREGSKETHDIQQGPQFLMITLKPTAYSIVYGLYFRVQITDLSVTPVSSLRTKYSQLQVQPLYNLNRGNYIVMDAYYLKTLLSATGYTQGMKCKHEQTKPDYECYDGTSRSFCVSCKLPGSLWW